jgi:phenylpropionate dioxygenase-like ring-hydroxylating dioxygenase large terminal subunit
MFLRNCWYAAGFSDDFGRSLTARTFLNEAVVLYRRRDGVPVALEDRCAHRRLPLSMGRLLEEDAIECLYHGLVYDGSGTCVKVPGQASVPASARVRSYPVVDRHSYLWIWMGEAEAADPALIPDYSYIDAAGDNVMRIRLHLECNYMLVFDNLLDLSHLAYVHATTTGNPSLAEDAVVKTAREGEKVLIKRWVRDVPPSRSFVDFGGYRGRVNLWQVSEYQAPCYIRVSYGSSDASVPLEEEADIWSEGHWGFKVLHGLAPETERTTHQFRTIAYDPGRTAPELVAELNRQNDQIIKEDQAIFAVQQRALDTDPRGLSALDLQSAAPIQADRGLTLARALLARRLEEEGGLAAGEAAA